MKQDYTCKFCNTSFHKESTLSTHMCVKKQRYLDADFAGPRIGFIAFQRFFEKNSSSKKTKTLEDFINSPYYIAFVKFGNHIELLKPVNTEEYINFVLTCGAKIDDWTRDFVYDTYIENFIKKEPPLDAVARTIEFIIKWSEKNNREFTKFFHEISANEAAYLIKTGKISPWVVYLASSAEKLTSRFNEDHSAMFSNIMDPYVWKKKFQTKKEEVSEIMSLLEQAGL